MVAYEDLQSLLEDLLEAFCLDTDSNVCSQPTVMYKTDHPVYPVLQAIGKEITQQVKPKAVVVFSAHWQARPSMVLVNNAQDTDLIYE